MHKSLSGLKPLVIGLLAAVMMIGCGAGTLEAATTSNGVSTSAPADPTQTAPPTVSVVPSPTFTPIPKPAPLLPSLSLAPPPDGAHAMLGFGHVYNGFHISPDENYVVAETRSGLAVLDSRTLTPLWISPVFGGWFVPTWSPDSSKIEVQGTSDAYVVDARNGEVLFHYHYPDSEDIYDILREAYWSRDGSLLAITSPNKIVVVDGETGGVITTFDNGYEEPRVTWSGDNQRLAATYDNGKAVIWDVAAGTTTDLSDGVLTMSPNMERFISGEFTKTSTAYTLVDTHTGETMLRSESEFVISHDWSKIAASDKGRTTVWDVGTGEVLWSLEQDIQEVRAIAWSPDDTLIATSSHESVGVWNANTGALEYNLNNDYLKILGTTSSINIRWVHNNGLMITGVETNGRLHVWNAQTSKLSSIVINTDLSPFVNNVCHCIWPLVVDEHRALVGLSGNGLFAWSLDEDRMLGQIVTTNADDLAWSDDSAQLAVVSDRWPFIENTTIWDIATGLPLETTLIEHKQGFNWVKRNDITIEIESPDGQRYVTESGDGLSYIEIWDSATDELVRRVWSGPWHHCCPTIIRWSPDGRFMLALANHGVFLWRASTGEIVHRQESCGEDRLFAFSPDMQWLAVECGGAVAILPLP